MSICDMLDARGWWLVSQHAMFTGGAICMGVSKNSGPTKKCWFLWFPFKTPQKQKGMYNIYIYVCGRGHTLLLSDGFFLSRRVPDEWNKEVPQAQSEVLRLSARVRLTPPYRGFHLRTCASGPFQKIMSQGTPISVFVCFWSFPKCVFIFLGHREP